MWQPIDSAPRDRWILLRGGQANEDFYDSGDPFNGTAETRPVVAHWQQLDEVGGCWVIGYWDGEWRNTYNYPTHWMDIPE